MGNDKAILGKTTRWMLLAMCLAGCSPTPLLPLEVDYSVTVTGTPATITISTVDVSAGYVKLAVTSNFNAYGATVYRNGFVCGHVDLSANGRIEFADTNFTVGGQYSYRVEGLFLYSGYVKSNLLAVTVPFGGGNGNGGNTVTAPAFLQAAPLDNSVRLAWEAVTGASSYNVYMGTSPGAPLDSRAKFPGCTSPATIPGLTNGTAYYFVTTAVDGSGTIESAPSPEVSATPHPPDVVQNLPSEVVLGNLDAPLGLPSDGGSIWLYEIYGGRLRRVDLSTGDQMLLATVAPSGNGGAIAADDGNIYFATWSTIFRVGKDGSNLAEFSRTTDASFILPLPAGILVRHDQTITMFSPDGGTATDFYVRQQSGSGFGGSMVADSTYLYWTDMYEGTIRRMALSGGPVVTMVSGASHPDDLLLDGNTLYFSTDGGIQTIPAGGGPVTSLTSTRGYMSKAGSFLYVANDAILSRVDLADGSATVLVTGIQSFSRPAVTDNNVYWLEAGSRYVSGYGSLKRVAR